MSIAACLAIALQLLPQDPPIQPAWSAELEDVILGTPASHGDLVFAASRNGKVRAFKIDTGESEWWFDAKADVLSNLVVFKDRLFVPGNSRSTILDPKSGKVLREDMPGASRVIVGPSRLYLLESLVWSAGKLHYGSSRSVTAFDPATGKAPWRVEIPLPGATTAIESGGRVFLPGDRLLLAVDAGSGKQVGESHDFDIAATQQVAADKDRLFLVTGGPKSFLCINKSTLKEQWAGEVKGNVRAIPPILQPDRLILFPLPNVVAFDLKTGKELWTIPLQGEPDYSTTPPATRGSEICVGSKGALYAIDAAAGKATWTLVAATMDRPANVSQPAWAGDRLLYAVGRKLLCFKLK